MPKKTSKIKVALGRYAQAPKQAAPRYQPEIDVNVDRYQMPNSPTTKNFKKLYSTDSGPERVNPWSEKAVARGVQTAGKESVRKSVYYTAQMVREVDPSARFAGMAGFKSLHDAASAFRKSQEYRALKSLTNGEKLSRDQLKKKFKFFYLKFMMNPDTQNRYRKLLGQETAGDKYAALKDQMGEA